MNKIFCLIKKSFWLPKEQAKQIKDTAKKQKISESALMRTVIINWFEK